MSFFMTSADALLKMENFTVLQKKSRSLHANKGYVIHQSKLFAHVTRNQIWTLRQKSNPYRYNFLKPFQELCLG